MTASTYLSQTDEVDPTSTLAVESAKGIAHQLADVAGAMFGLLLLQTSEQNQDVAPTDADEPSPAELSAPIAIALPVLPLPSVELPQEPAEARQPVNAIALPPSIPMPELPLDIEPTAGSLPLPLPVADAPRSMALLSEIGFLDD